MNRIGRLGHALRPAQCPQGPGQRAEVFEGALAGLGRQHVKRLAPEGQGGFLVAGLAVQHPVQEPGGGPGAGKAVADGRGHLVRLPQQFPRQRGQQRHHCLDAGRGVLDGGCQLKGLLHRAWRQHAGQRDQRLGAGGAAVGGNGLQGLAHEFRGKQRRQGCQRRLAETGAQ